ncbi:MAG: hypothetical protein IJK39_02280 [Bacteroidales bacterium]|nr:hypothetical protein [Bacteroidales bacterium]
MRVSTSGTEVSYTVTENSSESPRTGYIKITATNSDNRSVSKVISVTQNKPGTHTYTYSFTSAAWGATMDGGNANWTSGQQGAGFTEQGVQVTAHGSGANATSPIEFNDIEEIIVTYSTNNKKGKGSIIITVGNGTPKTFNVQSPGNAGGGTNPKTTSFSYSPKESGNVKIEVTCTENSVFISSISIKASE